MKVVCFIGKPGSGKSTLLKALQVPSIDIFSYLQKYFQGGSLVQEDDALLAYRELFKDLAQRMEDKVFLELGTNYPELVMTELQQFDTTVVFCLLSSEECWKRCQSRGRKIGTEQLQRRLARPFPEEHRKFSAGMNVVEVDMEKKVEENASTIRPLFEENS